MNRNVMQFLCGVILFGGAIFIEASELSIGSVYVKEVENEHYIVNISAKISMSHEQIQVLENGIPLIFVYNLRVAERGALGLFRKNKLNETYRYKLIYNGLTQQYVVKDFTTNRQDSYPTLSLALSHISEPKNIPINIINQSTKYNYQGSVRLWLDIEALPTPLRIPAYLSKNWRLNTGWKYWGFE